jgi:predicted DsbA family dithiol-disulfide isomerase
MAAEAARSQGVDAFDAFHFALLKARHEDKLDIVDKEVLVSVATGAGLDVERFRKDLEDRRSLKKLAEDHTFAVTSFNVFGTPTLVFEGKNAVFLKTTPPAEEDAVAMFDEVRQVAEGRRNIREIKRPG